MLSQARTEPVPCGRCAAISWDWVRMMSMKAALVSVAGLRVRFGSSLSVVMVL